MSISFSIRVIDEDGNPEEGREVHVSPDSILQGWEESFTDEDGWANFEYETNRNSITFSVRISGHDHGEITAADGDTFSVVYDP